MKRVRDEVAAGVRQLVLGAVCFALVTGAAEAAASGVQILLLRRVMFVSQDVTWMSPLAYLIFFLPLALLLGAVSLVAGRRIPLAWSVGMFGALTVFSWLLPFTQLSRWASAVLAAGVGTQLGRLAARAPVAWERGLRRAAAALALLIATTGSGVRVWRYVAERRAVAALPPGDTLHPNVLILVFDTVRRGNLGLYGYPRPTTPEIEKLARRSVVFDRAMATAPWTLTSHGSLFTGLSASATGGDWRGPITKGARTLAETFRSRGYLTGGFVSNLLYTSYESGLARGFVHYDDYPLSLHLVLLHASLGRTRLFVRVVEAGSWRAAARAVLGLNLAPSRAPADIFRPAERVTDAFLDWRRRAAPRPFFAFINYFDAHGPYRAPDAYLRRFGGTPPQPLERYDAAIAYLDHEVGRLVDSLQRRGVLERTLLIVTSDHGEQFGEHQLKGHANSLYLPLLEVPLLFSLPGVVPDGRRVDALVTLRDVAPTILELASIPNDRGIPGSSLARYWREGAEPTPSDIVAEVSKAINADTAHGNARGPMVSRLDERLHYIRSGTGSEELYAWRVDSLELTNLAGRPDMRAELARLRRGLVPR